MMKNLLCALLLLCCSSTLKAQADSVQYDTTVVYSETVQDEEISEEDSQIYAPPDSITYFDGGNYFIKVQSRVLPDSVIRRLKKDDAYWYADLEPNQKTVNRQNRREGSGGGSQNENVYDDDESVDSGGSSGIANIIWYILLIGFVGLLIWFLASGKFGLWQKKSMAIQSEDAVTEEDIHRLDFQHNIRKAEEAGNYRLAVRLWYLFTLKKLADQQIITYAQEKTNHQYVSQLYNTPYYSGFSQLTRNFDYVWYGMFPISQQAYAQLVHSFTQFHQQLS